MVSVPAIASPAGAKIHRTVAAIFGILDAGVLTLPADPGAPPPRNAAILMDCSISYAIMSATLFESLLKVWTGEPLQVAENMGEICFS
jgi:acyl-CoA synthetase (AMP-forming)/AMP-acid ligase II